MIVLGCREGVAGRSLRHLCPYSTAARLRQPPTRNARAVVRDFATILWCHRLCAVALRLAEPLAFGQPILSGCVP